MTKTLDSNMFKSGHVLYAAELNTLVGRINSIINDVVNIQTNDNGVTYDQVEDAIDDYYRSIIQGAINQLNSNLGNALRRLTSLEKGSGHEEGENYDLLWLRNDIGAIFRYMGITKDEETGIYTYALDMGSLADIDNIGQAIAALQTSASTNGDAIAGLTAGIIASYDEFGNPIYKFDPAQIILAINSSGDTIGKIKANYIELDGYVKASDIEAGNITITGDLRYNKIIGNVTEAVGNVTLGDGAYFVDIKQPTNDEEIVNLTMPLEPVTGLVIFIMNMENANSIVANVPMAIYYITRDQNDVPSLNTERVSANTPINPVLREMGNQVTQFLFDGSKWVQLNAPFISYNITRS